MHPLRDATRASAARAPPAARQPAALRASGRGGEGARAEEGRGGRRRRAAQTHRRRTRPPRDGRAISARFEARSLTSNIDYITRTRITGSSLLNERTL